METLLTVNELGYLSMSRDGDHIYLDTESGNFTTTLRVNILNMILFTIITGQDIPNDFPNPDSVIVKLDHELNEVTISIASEEATFNQIKFVQFINVARVRELKLAQIDRKLKRKSQYL